jgi:hypothetical protein
MLRASTGLPADKAYEQLFDSRTAYPRQVRLSARGYRGANLPRAVLVKPDTMAKTRKPRPLRAKFSALHKKTSWLESHWRTRRLS